MRNSTKTSLMLIVVDILAASLILTALFMVFYYAPVEVEMGLVQKIFYFHVAAAWTGMLGFLVAFAAGIGLLRSGNMKWDIAGVAGVEIGLVFISLSTIMGSIWARPIWNTWWTWDPRLSTALIMMLIYFAYLLLRNGVEEPGRRARFSAVYAIVGFVSVPLTFMSIRLFRTIHPVIIGSSDPAATGVFEMSTRMTHTFMISLVAFSVLFVALFWHRVRLGVKLALFEQRKMEDFTGED
ncbi:MAG: cytochrome C assembly protein [Anaerolinea sp.]|nr:cytochrome C assembly protein [Anaerolinea sp.]